CPIREMADACDAITTSSEALAGFVRNYTSRPVVWIPDRLDLAAFPERKQHTEGRTETAAWFGYSANFPMLDAALPALLEPGIRRLIVVAHSAEPYSLPKRAETGIELINYPWELSTVNHHLLEADIVINWRATYGRWRYKSNNKTVTSWAMGLPVAHCADELF